MAAMSAARTQQATKTEVKVATLVSSDRPDSVEPPADGGGGGICRRGGGHPLMVSQGVYLTDCIADANNPSRSELHYVL